MFTKQSINQSESSAGAKPKRAEVSTAAKGVSEQNPLWQSLALRTNSIQTKLAVSRPDDPYEREADAHADDVMRMSEPRLQRDCACGGGCSECQNEKGAHERSQTVPAQVNDTAQGVAPPLVNEALHSSGQALDSTTREFMESRLGQDFGGVRVHTDARAEESARAVNALAYTVGRDVVFGHGQYAPESHDGKRLLAHELTHVAQQQQQTAPALQRQPINNTPVNVASTASEVEALVRPGNDEKGALEKLDALDMRDLLDVVERLYDDAKATETDEGKRRAYSLLNGDLATAPNKTTASVKVPRLRAAFDAAPVRKQRNPNSGLKDSGTNPTLSGSRKAASAPKGVARPGDWGEDPAGNTWVSHVEGIRTYFGTATPGDKRSSSWLGNNPGNADYVKSITKRAIGSFHWGKGTHDFAIYFSLDDGSADLRDRVKHFSTIGDHIRAHLGPNPADNNDFDTYVGNIQKKAKMTPDDATSVWTGSDTKWAEILEGFKLAEGWLEGKTLTAANVGTASSDPKDAAVVAYYSTLLGASTGSTTP